MASRNTLAEIIHPRRFAMRQASYASFTDERRIADFDPSGHQIRRLVLCGNDGTPTRRLRKCEWKLAGGRYVISPGEGTFSVMSVAEVAVSSPRSHSPSTACSFMPVTLCWYKRDASTRLPNRQAGHGLGRGLSGFVLVLLALEFVERRAIGAILRGLGHAALGRDLRAEVAWLHEHDVNAKRARL
jgi:hypothetical protein